ncbi:MAG: ABC transporter ATP-binding protein [Desulfatirhabdiaceae bacterium]
MKPAEDILISADGLTKIYTRGSEEIHAIRDISLKIRRGEYVAFIGPSGSGKTTLINILGCLDNPSSGSLSIDGRMVMGSGRPLGETELTAIRRERYGYIFQKFYLIPTLTVAENILLPCTFYHKAGAEEHLIYLLDLLGLANRQHHLPGQLSGGEMQRVAIARALINRPSILLADEPTGNLDTARSQEIGEVLNQLNRKEGLTIILVTHNLVLSRTADRIIELQDGRIMDS